MSKIQLKGVKAIPFNNGKLANTNFKTIKKLDFENIDKSKVETETTKEKAESIEKNKNEIEAERENLAEAQIAKDLEHYIEFLSSEDELCDKLLNYQMPYLFLGINSKQSLLLNKSDINEAKMKRNQEFFERIEKKLDNSPKNSSPNIKSEEKSVTVHTNNPSVNNTSANVSCSNSSILNPKKIIIERKSKNSFTSFGK